MAVKSGSPFGLRLRATLSRITEEAAHLLGVEGAGLRLLEGDELVRVAAYGPEGAVMARERLKLGESLSGRVAVTGQPVAVATPEVDPSQDPVYRAMARRHGFRSWLGVPLRDQERVIGVLVMQSRTEERFGPADVRLLEAFAGQAAVAIENAQLYEREHERRRQLEAVREVTAWLASETDLATLLERISRLATELLSVRSVAVYLWDEASETLVPRAWHGFGDWLGDLHLKLGEGLTGTVAQRRVGIIADDYRAAPFAQPVVVERTTAVAALGEPLIYEGELRGVITASAEPGERTFDEQDREVLALFAAQAMIAIEHARLHEARDRALAEAEARRRRAGFLAEASASLASSLDYDATLQQVARLAVPTIGDVCTVFVVAEDGEVRRAATVHDDSISESLVEALWRSWSGLASPNSSVATAIRTGRPVFTPAISLDHRESIAENAEHLQTLHALGFHASIVVPLHARGETTGALAFFLSDSARQYDPTDLALAESLAGRAALAVDNARLYREARRAIQIRDEFLSVAAHELKTPITTLLGFSQLLLSQLDRKDALDDRIVVRALRAVEQGSRRMSRLVTQILDVSRLDGGRLTLDLQDADLAPLVRGIAEAMQTTTSRHAIRVQTPESLPAVVDPLRLEQVVTNLLDNAIKFSPTGGEIEIELSQPAPGTGRLVVTDHGVGIPPERRDHIFERFYQAHEGDHVAGLGLGLFISRQIVELHGGSITPEFPLDGGCRFSIDLPTEPADTAVPVNAARGAMGTMGAMGEGKERAP
jgi:signal transduction histidine kinase/putative methionine-R-sulfoxide reductase with GAF domain